LSAVTVSGALLTAWERAELVLAVNVPPPLYSAVMLCEPAPRPEVEHCAELALTETAEQIGVAPSLNVTVPVAPTLGLIDAVNVTEFPYVLGLAFDASVVVVAPVTENVAVSRRLLPVQLGLAQALTVHVPDAETTCESSN
jgi:hypothetical protein